eukprot:932701_1
MFPVLCTTQLAADKQMNVLSASFMGSIWNCALYHAYIDDKMHVHSTNVQQILRVICILPQILVENFVQSFAFRLTNEWDYIDDSNKETIMMKYDDTADSCSDEERRGKRG